MRFECARNASELSNNSRRVTLASLKSARLIEANVYIVRTMHLLNQHAGFWGAVACAGFLRMLSSRIVSGWMSLSQVFPGSSNNQLLVSQKRGSLTLAHAICSRVVKRRRRGTGAHKAIRRARAITVEPSQRGRDFPMRSHSRREKSPSIIHAGRA